MAGRTPTRHGASAGAGRSSSKGKTAPRRAAASSSARSSAHSAPRTSSRSAARTVPTRKPASRKQRPRFSLPPYLPYLLVACLVVVGWQLYPVAKLHYKQQRDLGRLERQLADIRQRNQKLKSEVDRLKTKEGVEEAARHLGLARKGEQVWIPVDGKSQSASIPAGPAVDTASAVDEGPWTRFLDVVFGVTP